MNDKSSKAQKFGRRKLLRNSVGVGGALLVGGRIRPATAAQQPYFYAYADKTSVALGGNIVIHYLTNQPQFHISVYRQGTSLSLVSTSGPFSSVVQTDAVLAQASLNPTHPAHDFQWPSTTASPQSAPVQVSVPTTWIPGVYVLMFTASDAKGNATVAPTTTSAWAPMAQCLVVIRRAPSSTPPAVMYKLPLFTYCAYSTSGGFGLYYAPVTDTAPDGAGGTHSGWRVTLRRAGCGTGGDTWFATQGAFENDVIDGSSPFNCFAHWDAKMIAWLEDPSRYPAGTLDYCTDVDLHDKPQLLSGTRLLVSAGHDEYWSSAMRDQVEAFIARGGNVAFFGGNTSYWRVYCASDGVDKTTTDAFVCDKTWNGAYDNSIDGNDLWWEPQTKPLDPSTPPMPLSNRPENTMTGVSSRNAGFVVQSSNGPGYTTQLTEEWVFANTGLTDLAIIGGDDHLINYEADGAAYGPQQTPGVAGAPLTPWTADKTPSTFRILGYAVIPAGWAQPDREAPPSLKYLATMGYFSKVGTVFNAATTEWPRVLTGGTTGAAAVSQITTNVLRGLDSGRVVQCAGDCNGDGITDIVLRHPVSGAVSFWYCSGGSVSSSRYSDYHYQQQPGWNLVAVADFNGDGGIDYVWYASATGQIVFWYTDGINVLGGAQVARSQDPAWTLVSAADFNRDGHCDLIFQNRSTGQMAVWYMNNTTVLGGEFVTPTQDPAYTLICATDLNHDGKPDLLFHNRTTGQATVWLMTSGVAYTDGHFLSATTAPGWNIVAAGMFGIGGATTAQILLQNLQTGALQVWTLASDGHTVLGQVTLTLRP
jgi:hypothetical protein